MPGHPVHDLWAKCDSERYHPLLWHLLDTGFVAYQMWKYNIGSNAKKIIIKTLQMTEKSALAWIPFIAALHDMGKASEVFQFQNRERAQYLTSAGIPQSQIRMGNNIRHTKFGCVVLKDMLTQQDSNQLIQNKQTVIKLAKTISGHHGVFDTNLDDRNIVAAWEPAKCDFWRNIRKELLQSLSEIFMPSRSEAPCIDKDELDNTAFMLLAALVSVSDWISSNEEYFPYKPDVTVSGDYAEYSRMQAAAALKSLHWNDAQPHYIQKDFAALFPSIGNGMRPVQKMMSALSNSRIQPRLIIVEVPMGEGKTEAALLMQHNWLKNLGQRGAYIALPTMATSNQMFSRVKEYLPASLGNAYVNFHLLHSHSLFSDEYAEMKMNSVNPDEKNGALIADEWFCKRKRGLLAPYAVGTVDQALLSVLQTRHGFVRLFGLADKTVIFDEVHAYDLYMTTIFKRLLEWLGKIRVTVIILSATLTKSRVMELIQSYAGSSTGSSIANYPRVTWVDEGDAVHSEKTETSCSSNQIIRWVEDDPAHIALELSSLMSEGGCVAWICNTVHRAQNAYAVLKNVLKDTDIEVDLFHARYPFAERDKREKRAIERFGKSGERPRKAILVATQVIEQSLDLDFDLMISDLAPIDLLIQRGGRIHRHERGRPIQMSQKALWIIKPAGHENDEPVFMSSVYNEWVLYRSWFAIRNRRNILIPDDIEGLIESVYGDSPPDDMTPDMIERDSQLKKEFDKDGRTLEFNAKTNLLPEPEGASLLDCWNRELNEDNPDIHQMLQARTRDSGPSVSIICIHEINGGTFLDGNGCNPLDMSAVPDKNMIKEILKSEAHLSYKSCLKDFSEDMIPVSWKKTASLRFHRAVVFINGLHPPTGMVLDADRGIVMTFQNRKGVGNDPVIQSDF